MRRTRPSRRATASLITLTTCGLAGAFLSGPAMATAAGLPVTQHQQASPGQPGPRPAFIGQARPLPLPAGQQMACPPPTRPGRMQCMSIVRTAPSARPRSAWLAAPGSRVIGYSPASLRTAYRLILASSRRGRGETVAIVDAYSDPKAAADLSVYRRHYSLPPCTVASGCLRIVNQHGRSGPLPAPNRNWAFEESLDLDMVSAICPNCRILLVQASSNQIADLGQAEQTAVAKGARFISNSWSSSEYVGEQTTDHFFNHPGIAITFASGDLGYGTAYPADTQYVTAVGGTALRRARNARGWTEQAWAGTGSGCSSLEAKAPWQRADDSAPDGCLNRTGNDVAAVASLSTGVSVYDSYESGATWLEAGGTSVATPLIAAVYALAGTPARDTYPAQYPYQHPRHLFDVTSGTNGQCEPNRAYLCKGRTGYDGPTGLGTPDGLTAFSGAGLQAVTLTDPGTRDAQASTSFTLRIDGADTNARATSLAYSATGLPAGLSITPVPHSLNAAITGRLPAAPAVARVTVTAKDTSTGKAGTTTFSLVSVGSLLSASPASGLVTEGAAGSGPCLTSAATTAGSLVSAIPCAASQPSQVWTYLPAGNPGGPGTLRMSGLCLGASGRGAQAAVAACDGAASQSWQDLGFGVLANVRSGLCLTQALTTPGVVSEPCTGITRQRWQLPSGPVRSGAHGFCLDFNGNFNSPPDVAACTGDLYRQSWTWTTGSALASGVGWCLDTYSHLLDGAPIQMSDSCYYGTGYAGQAWIAGPGGELISAYSGKCLADPRNGGSGTGLVLEDCYGLPGEIWAIN